VRALESLRADRALDLALVEHLDVAAERNRGDHELGAVTVDARPQGGAEADREFQHLDAAAPRDHEMAVFVEGDEQAEGDDQPPDGTEEFSHDAGWIPERRATALRPRERRGRKGWR
jgi:hypothetical protein